MDVEQRARFEQWATQKGLGIERDTGGSYLQEETFGAWNGWRAALTPPEGHVVVTRNEAGQAVAVTRQDEEGRILSVIAELEPPEGYVLIEKSKATDSERLDFLDAMNVALNSHYGTNYGWRLILSPQITRLMCGQQHQGFVGDIDLNDQNGGRTGFLGCREAIDAARPEVKP